MAAITICSDFGAQKNKVSHCFHFLCLLMTLQLDHSCLCALLFPDDSIHHTAQTDENSLLQPVIILIILPWTVSKLPTAFFGIEQRPQFYTTLWPWKAKMILGEGKEREQSWRTHTSWFKLITKLQRSKQYETDLGTDYKSMKQNWESRNSSIYHQLIFHNSV